jgi:hypothetical protein
MQYARSLGRQVPEDHCHRLASFIFRLSGTADSPAVENAWLDFLWIETTRRICQPYAEVKTPEVRTIEGVEAWGSEVRRIDQGLLRITAIFCEIGVPTFRLAVSSAGFAAGVAFSAIGRLRRPELWGHTLDILDGTIKLGRDEPMDAHLGSARLRAARLAKVA